MQKSSRKKPQHGYLYLIEVRRSRPWLHKVGITQNPNARFFSFDEANPRSNVVLRVIYVKGYEAKESWIKDYFSNRAYFFHPFRDNGATEVFRFTWLDLAIITIKMEWWALMDDWRIWAAWHLIIFIVFGYGLFRLFPWIIDFI
jgi:hypothetical protein